MNQVIHHPLYLKGIEYFNQREFFEAHDAWEEYWTEYQGPSRNFYKGLIQVAVSLYHFGRANLRGAKKLYQSSRMYLQPYLPVHLDLDLEKLFCEFEHCFAEVFDAEEKLSTEESAKVKLNPDWLPTITLNCETPEDTTIQSDAPLEN